VERVFIEHLFENQRRMKDNSVQFNGR